MANDENTKQRFKAKEVDYANKAARREFDALPEEHRIAFMHSLNLVAYGLPPGLKIDHLESVGSGVIELKINGSPAYRCVYYNKVPGKVIVLHAAVKTTNGPDPKILKTAKKRLKALQ